MRGVLVGDVCQGRRFGKSSPPGSGGARPFWRIWTYTGPCMRLGIGCTRVRVLVDGVRLDADLVVQAHIEDEASDEEPEV